MFCEFRERLFVKKRDFTNLGLPPLQIVKLIQIEIEKFLPTSDLDINHN